MDNTILDKVSSYIRENALFKPSDSLLVAISGGIDSVTMLDMLVQLGYQVVVAHCNFSLRGEESNGDEIFVEQMAKEYKVPFYKTRFDTRQIARTQEVSIQMAARTLRYEWFETMRVTHKLRYIAVAHNLNDSIETFFINFIRGTGIKGLTGISPVNGRVVRPLLSLTRSEIETYAAARGLTCREDSSNASTRYTRNFIRHRVIPSFIEVAPSFYTTFAENIERLKDAGQIYERYAAEATKGVVSVRDGKTFIDLARLNKIEACQSVLFEILSEYGFSSDTCSVISRKLNVQPGSQFHSDTHLLVKDRGTLIIAPKVAIDDDEYIIGQGTRTVNMPVRLRIETSEVQGQFVPVRDKNVAQIDASRLQFPLTIRRWRDGDRFVPFGMAGMKKLSDFFTDSKATFFQKREAWLLCSGGDIVWVIGQRMDNRFRVTADTQTILTLRSIT